MARRVNTKFLTYFTVAVIGLLVFGLVAKRFLIRESPEKYVSRGSQEMAEKQFDKAAADFARAVSLDPKNPSLWVAYGDALNELSPTDIEYMRRARDAWGRALAVDPNNKPALDRMMQFWSDVANLDASRPEVFKGLKETASRLWDADRGNAAAEIAIWTSDIRPWLAGVEQDETKIVTAINKLADLQKKYPENPDLPMFVGQGLLRLSDRRQQQDRTKEAKDLVDRANKVVEQAIKTTPTADMYFSAAQVAQTEEGLASSGGHPDKKAELEWHDKKRLYYTKARELSKPEDPLYTMIHIQAARAAADRPESEKILRELYATKPEDQEVRLALAEQLSVDKDKRSEALEILDKPFGGSSLKGPKAYLIRELQIRTLVNATNLRLEAMAHSGDAKQKNELLAKIQSGLDMIASRDGEGPRVLRLRGKLLRIQRRDVEAIQTLERARALAEKNGALELQGDRLDRWEVIDMLARAYIDTQQTGRAKDLLTELVNKFPQYDPARELLAQLLLQEGARAEAKPHVDYLTRKNPTDPDVIKLQLQMMDDKQSKVTQKGEAERKGKAMRAAFNNLPENDKFQMLDKINAAMAIEQQDDATRLLNKVNTAYPGDYDVARMAVRIYRQTGDTEAAKAFVDASLKANPKEPKLKVLQEQVKDLTPEGLARVALGEFQKNPDKFISALGQANCYRRLNDPDHCLEQLLIGKQMKPEDGDVNSLLFSFYLWQKQWDKAEGLLDVLSRTNEGAGQDQASGLLFKYKLAMAREDYSSGLKYGQALVQRMGEFALSWLAMGQAQQATGDPEAALKSFLAALERQSDNPDALRGAIECYYTLNRYPEARRTITDARRALPANPAFQEMEVQYELNYGDPERAVPPREELVKKEPNKMANVMALGQAYLATARARAEKNDQDKATDYFNKAKGAFRQGITKWPDEIAFYAYFAETAARSGDLGDSEALLKQLAARPAWQNKPEPQTLLAEFYGVSRRPDDAEKALRAVLAQNPANVDAELKLANLLVNSKKVDEAIKALEGNKTDLRIAKRRVEILINANRAEQADKEIDEILTRTPSALEILQMAIGINVARQNFDMAEKRMQRALEIDKKNPTTLYYVGMLRMTQPRPDLDEAIRAFTVASASPTVGTEARFAMADCLRRKSDPDGAIKCLEDAIKDKPNDKRIRLALLDSYANLQPPRWVDEERVIREAEQMPGYTPDVDLLVRSAAMWAARGEYKVALEKVSKALEIKPDNIGLTRQQLSLMIKLHRYGEVMSKVDELVAKDKNLWWAYQERAKAKREQGHKEEAIKDFELALDTAGELKDDIAAQEIARAMGDTIGPDEAITRIAPRAEKDDRFKLLVARLQQAKGDTAASIKTLEQVLAQAEHLAPQDRQSAYRFGGTIYLMVNQTEKSRQCYTELLKMAPDDMTALNNMACLLAENVQPPQPQEGLQYSQHAYDLMQKGNRRDALVLDTHGWILTLCGQVDEGIDVLRKANEIKQIPDTHYHLGEAYLKKQFGEEAMRELEMAMELVKRAVTLKQEVDPSLQPKIEAAIGRAGVMMRQKKSTAEAVNPQP